MQNRDNTSQNNTHLTGRQQRVINALLFSTSVTHASQVSGVSRQRIHVWLNQPEFRDELAKARQAVRQDSIESLKILFAHAVDTLSEILLNSQDERTKVKICEIVLNYNYNFIELSELDSRLKVLESRQ